MHIPPDIDPDSPDGREAYKRFHDEADGSFQWKTTDHEGKLRHSSSLPFKVIAIDYDPADDIPVLVRGEIFAPIDHTPSGLDESALMERAARILLDTENTDSVVEAFRQYIIDDLGWERDAWAEALR